MNDTSVVQKCKCKHPAQDKFHGAGNRVHTFRGKDRRAVCTVCGAPPRNIERLALHAKAGR
jgi:hypothetical protein